VCCSGAPAIGLCARNSAGWCDLVDTPAMQSLGDGRPTLPVVDFC